MSRTPLQRSEAESALAKLQNWSLEEGGKAIRRTFEFADFSQAFAFMTRAALAAEKLDHHPEWFNVYKRVEVRLTTHDADGLTSLDFDLARRMDRFATG